MKQRRSIPLTQAPSAAAPGRRERKAQATRRAILDAGLKAFESTPLALISVQDITDAADVAKGVFYLHFRSRDHYLLALWSEVQRVFFERADDATIGRKSIRARLEALSRVYADMASHSKREVTFWMRMNSYIGDEIGAPGELLALRRSYFERLAHLVCGKTSADALDLAGTVDACCWAIIRHNQTMQMKPPTAETLIERVLPAVRELCRRVGEPHRGR